ncbi:MAG: hypothetical protein EOO61_13755 [Hymenobacter sp.]|nr:MAG: hypothetical protein EOO61_13755 [Hymenobacter sp.]
MAASYSFERPDENSLIELTAELNDSSFSIILDTGATHTVIDFGVLIEEGYLLDDTKGLTFFETANGIKEANIFRVKQLSCLGITRTDFEISAYLLDDPQASAKGVIGLDFLAGFTICIDLNENKVTVNE